MAGSVRVWMSVIGGIKEEQSDCLKSIWSLDNPIVQEKMKKKGGEHSCSPPLIPLSWSGESDCFSFF